jgi:phage shock protein A
MNIFSAIFNALKDGTTQIGEAAVDNNDIAVFENALQNMRSSVDKAKESRAAIIAQQHYRKSKIKALHKQIDLHKEHALNAVSKHDETLALSIAGEIVALEQTNTHDTLLIDQFQKHLDKIAEQIERLGSQLKDMENHLSQVKATESVHKAQSLIHATGAANKSSVLSARDSLALIKGKQEEVQASIEVADEVAACISDNAKKEQLDAKLEASNAASSASTAASAQALLNRLKNEK